MERPPLEAPNFVMTHVGAHGYCDVCGHDFDLTEKDRPIEYRSKQRYEIPCPQCGRTVSVDARLVAEDGIRMERPRTHDRGSSAPIVTIAPKYVPSHVGAHGYCNHCGRTFTLSDRDKPHKIIVEGDEYLGRVVFLVKCPCDGCGSVDDAHAEVVIKRKRSKEN